MKFDMIQYRDNLLKGVNYLISRRESDYQFLNQLAEDMLKTEGQRRIEARRLGLPEPHHEVRSWRLRSCTIKSK